MMNGDNNKWLLRDGTSQAGRLLPELDPDYAQVDERTTQDLLAFAREYAKELKYFSLDDQDHGLDWSGFIGENIDLDDAAKFANASETFPVEKAAPYTRPHFSLFLVFLELLSHTRQQINQLTRRHLEFCYRDVLRMIRKQSVPDQVHVLVELDSGTEQLALPAGTPLQAGKDSLGHELVYRTDEMLIANRVEVGKISSLHAQINVTGIRQACPPNLVGGNRRDAFVRMLRIALGQPNPGDPLPTLTYPAVPPLAPSNSEVSFDLLVQAQQLLQVVSIGMAMPLFDDFRSLIDLKRRCDENDGRDWQQIYAILTKAGVSRTGNPNFRLLNPAPNNFLENVRAGLGLSQEDFARWFDGLPEVKSMEEAYDLYPMRADVQKFIQPPTEPVDGVVPKSLYLSLDDFKLMMQTKTSMDNRWNEITRLLEEAAQRKQNDPDYKLSIEARASRDFGAKFTAAGLVLNAGPEFQFSGNLDQYFQALLAVEKYFYMPAENYQFILAVVTHPNGSVAEKINQDITQEWNKVYEIVEVAHREMIYARRRKALEEVVRPVTDNAKALSDLLAFVLGSKISFEQARKELKSLGILDKDQNFLEAIANGDPNPSWEQVFKILEVAQRNRENLPEPIAEKIEWRNLFPALDAPSVLVQSVGSVNETLPRWKTFGRPAPMQQREVLPILFGWAMASPLLEMSEGDRTITLTLGFSSRPENFDLGEIKKLLDPPFDAPQEAGFNPFVVGLSTEKGWLEPASMTLTWSSSNMTYPKVAGLDSSELRGLVFQIKLSNSQPALTSLTSDIHGFDTSVPVLRLMVKPVWDEQDDCYVTSSYTALRKLLLLRAHLAVSVEGLTSLHLANDQSNLDAKKPFEPFGTQPAVGSRFYLGHPEIVGKKLDSLGFHLTWMGVPSNLGAHYGNYKENTDPAKLANTSFKAKVSLVERGVSRIFPASLPLFDVKDAAAPSATPLAPPVDQGNPDDAICTGTDVTEWNRYLVWELDAPDLQHADYPNKVLQKSLEMAAAIASSKEVIAGNYQVNPPYTPKMKSLSVDYKASAELVFDAVTKDAVALQAFHVQPFGYAALKSEEGQPGCQFLPQYDFEGELYIGLRNVSAPQTLSLLFQVAEGSANPDLVPEPVQWSYLSGNRWLSLHDGSLLADATRGFINSGIVEFALKPAQPNTLLSGDLYWIRAAIARASESVCDMVKIHPNAVLATFAPDHNAVDHLATPLPPKHITGLVTPVSGLVRISQPYTSFGGKMAEQDTNFYIRVSERLRHKQRALTPWDYERLVLEKYPQLYKVKCLRADQNTHSHDQGKIVLVVIPDIKNRLPFNPFEPKVPADQIRNIEMFLQDKTPPFASIEVRNANYVPVKVRCGVRFRPGKDEGFCRRRLNEELNRFLSPWAYEEGTDLVIGGSIYANSIINFIDGRDYVDYLAGFKLFTGRNEDPVVETEEGYHVSANNPDDVLVAAREHVFDVISDIDYRFEEFTGINYLKIELDFAVA